MLLARALAGRGDLARLRPGIARGPLLVAHEGRCAAPRGAGLPDDRPGQGRRGRMAGGRRGRPAPSPAARHLPRRQPRAAQALFDRRSLGRCFRDPVERVRKAAPADLPTLLSMRLRSEMERVAPEETVPRLERYVAADPTDWEALRALARAEQSLDRPAEARRHFEACLKGQPENPRVWRDYLIALHEQGDMDALGRVAGQGPPGGAERGRDLAVPRPAQGEGRRLDRGGRGLSRGAAAEPLYPRPSLPAGDGRGAARPSRRGRRAPSAGRKPCAGREQLRTAFDDFVAARELGDAGRSSLKASMKRLASVCETLGWLRLATAWNQLANSS